MERVTIRLTREQLEEIESLVEGGHYKDRSSAIRDGIRRLANAHADNLPGRHPLDESAWDDVAQDGRVPLGGASQ